MRFLSIILGTFIFLGTIAGTIFYWGMGRVFPKYHHPFLETQKPWIALPWSEQDKLLGNEKNEKKESQSIIWADVYATSQDTLLVEPFGEVPKKNKPEISSAERPLLTDLFRKYPQRKFILNVTASTFRIESLLLSVAQPLIEKKQILIQSEFDIVLRAMKDAFADLPYGSSQSDWLRMTSFYSMAPWSAGLLPAAPFRGDVYIAPLVWRKIPMINLAIAQEIHRRQKFVLIGPLKNQEEFQQAQSLGADGYLFQSEKLAKEVADKIISY